MDTAEELRQRRDHALKAWRREVGLLGDLVKSANPLAAAVENQKKAIIEARDLYDSSNEDYLNFIEHARLEPKARDRLADLRR
jgi:hypothetical protein